MLLKPEEIIIKENRQRRAFDEDAMQALRDSILSAGLLQPVVVREEEGRWVLVAGERRLRTLIDIFQLEGSYKFSGQVVSDGYIACTSLGELAPLQAEEAELDENIRRADLTWQEQADALMRLNKLREAQRDVVIKQAEEAKKAAPTPQAAAAIVVPKRVTAADTALEVYGRRDGSYQAKVAESIVLANNLHIPEVAAAKTQKEALKILKSVKEREQSRELADRVGKVYSASAHTIFNMNCLDFMQQMVGAEESNKFDVICADPPYGMGADTFGDGGGKMTGISHHYDDSYENWVKLMPRFAELSFMCSKTQAHCYLFCDFDRFHELKAFMEKAGWYVFRTPLIYQKRNSGRVPLPDRGPRRTWELCLYAIKGNKPVTHIYPDFLQADAEGENKHGAQKPPSVFQNLLQRSVKPGDKVFDGFGGSGPILEAATNLKVFATVCELDPASYALCVEALESLKSLENPGLF